MGMDCHGVENTDAYFRANMWSWHPLWTACHHIAPHIIDKDAFKYGSFNDGFEIPTEKCLPLAKVLKVSLETGFFEWWVREVVEPQADEHGMQCYREHWDEFVEFLEACGGFRIH